MGKCVALFILLVALSHAAKNQNRRKKTQQPVGNLVLLDETKEPMCSMDVVFLLDSSEKATPLVFEKQRALTRIFAQRVMQMQTSHWRLRVRLAALQYSSTISVETGFRDWLDLGEFHSRVGRMAYLGQGTNSAYALGNATQMFVRETEPSSLRVALLMGDGEDDPDAPSAVATATIAKRAGVRIFTVGLTNEAREAANSATLRSIASAPAQNYVLNLNDNELQDQLLQEMTRIAEDGCPQPNFCSCEKGARGTPGSPGKKGDVGNRGPPGPKGTKGEHGRHGLQGIEGIQGKPGGRGDKGQRGERGAPGDKGAQGPDGPIGQRGVRGEQGLPGPAGDQGTSGREGPRGERGPTGITGLPGNPGFGYPGPKGDKGAAGRPGPPGPAGVGEPGLPGLPGTIGLQGISGVPGEGIPGPKGDQGLEGPMGQRGSPGVGVKGDKGNTGGKGLLGPLGFPGSGIQGEKGDQGPVGPTGPRGAPGVGLVGPKGNRGFPGEPGLPGIRGIGVPGMQGDGGQNGTAGFPGIPGEDGAVGQKGETGLPGPRGPEGAPGSGEPGEKGDRGDRGHRGLPGVVGPVGPAGAKGEPGIPGLTGLPGQMGRSLPGSKGDPGTPGPLGPAGEVGIGTIGPKGDRGLPGPVGPAGARGQGSPGAQGAPGLPGLPGETGPEGRGFPGPKGNRGVPGALGSLGPPGMGLIGSSGPPGQMGPAGPQGQSGEGIQGPKGELGVHGMPGPRGAPGEGRIGLKGSRGPDGERGRKGEAGDMGSPGLPGALGAPGEKGDPGLTKEEVMEIIREVCGCGLRCSEQPQELMFVIDGSESVGQENFNLVKNFVSALLDRIPVRRDATRVGVVQYSLVAEVTVGLQQKRWDVDAVKAAVRAMRYMGEGTYTGSALARAARELQGARPGARKVLVLLTDGQTDRRDPVYLEDAAREARDDGIEVFVVGVANRRDPHFAEFVAEMNTVASDPDREHVFMIDDFGTLTALEGKLLNRICQYGDSTIFTAIAGSLLPGRGDTPTFSRTSSLDEDSLNTLTDSLVRLLPSAAPHTDPRTRPNWQYDPETTETLLTRPLPPLAQEIFTPDVRCEEPLDPGPCRKYEVMWYYDSPANSCAQFWFGGCDGNKNRFDSEASCIRACVRRI